MFVCVFRGNIQPFDYSMCPHSAFNMASKWPLKALQTLPTSTDSRLAMDLLMLDFRQSTFLWLVAQAPSSTLPHK